MSPAAGNSLHNCAPRLDAAAEQEKLRLVDRVLQTNQDYFRLMKARVDHGDAAPVEADLFATELSRIEAQQL